MSRPLLSETPGWSSRNFAFKFRDEMHPRCDWCRRRFRAKPKGRTARFCSASCRQRAYERRKLVKRKQAEADAINAVEAPGWTARLFGVKPNLPPRHRPRRLKCPACWLEFVVKTRGPIPETCSRRCAHALALYRSYVQGKSEGLMRLKKDVVAVARLGEQRRRHQVTIDDMLTKIGVRRSR